MRTIRTKRHIFPAYRTVTVWVGLLLIAVLIAFVSKAGIDRMRLADADTVPRPASAPFDPTDPIPVAQAPASGVTPDRTEETSIPSHPGRCTAREPLSGLERSTLAQVRRLAEYQTLCDSFVSDEMMYFIGFPDSERRAVPLANTVATALKEFHRNGISPIVILEPTTESGGYVNLERIASGSYDAKLGIFFDQLRRDGVTDEMLGLWVPYPEINIPEWDAKGFEKRHFSDMVNRFFAVMRSRYPDARGSILMNAASFEPDDTDYAHASYEDFSPYIGGISAGTVESFGLQGFPYKPPGGAADRSAMTSGTFLHPELARAAARGLGVTSLWFNTGTFASMYGGNDRVTASSAERTSALSSVLSDVNRLREEGFAVSLNIFAENKIATDEATDWSYGNLTEPKNAHRSVLLDFITSAADAGIRLSFFNE